MISINSSKTKNSIRKSWINSYKRMKILLILMYLINRMFKNKIKILK